MHSAWKSISIRYMEDAKVTVETEILHIADMHISKTVEKSSVAVGNISGRHMERIGEVECLNITLSLSIMERK